MTGTPETYPYPSRPLIQPQPPAVPARAELAPCETCGEPRPVVPYTYATENPYGACPAQEAEECTKRGQAKKAAREAAAREAAEKAAAEPEPEPEAKPAPRRPRPSAARKAALGQGPAKSAEDTTEPPEGAA